LSSFTSIAPANIKRLKARALAVVKDCCLI
jgi:hypothetical protein